MCLGFLAWAEWVLAFSQGTPPPTPRTQILSTRSQRADTPDAMLNVHRAEGWHLGSGGGEISSKPHDLLFSCMIKTKSF